jgi:hypothetical protein
MRCNKILGVEELERRAMSRNLMRSRNQIIRRKRESRGMKCLANVASCFGALGVMVQKREAGHDVQQHETAKDGKHLARELRLEDS